MEAPEDSVPVHEVVLMVEVLVPRSGWQEQSSGACWGPLGHSPLPVGTTSWAAEPFHICTLLFPQKAL